MPVFGGAGLAFAAPFIADIGMDYWSTKKTNEAMQGMSREQMDWQTVESEKQRDWSAGEAQLQRNFGERMSSSAVQRRMADLKRAGINPILAGKFDAGTPASGIPGGSSASSIGMPGFKKMEKHLLASTAADVRAKHANVGLIEAQTAKTAKETDFVGSKTDALSFLAEVMPILASNVRDAKDRYRLSKISEDLGRSYRESDQGKAQKVRKQKGIEITEHVKSQGKKGRKKKREDYYRRQPLKGEY